NDYFAFSDFVLCGGDIKWDIFQIVSNKELANKVEEEILSRAAAIMSGEELESFKSWFNLTIYLHAKIEDELYSKMSIEEMSIEDGDSPIVMITTSHNHATKEIWDLASSHTPNLQEQIDAEEYYFVEEVGGKYYASFKTKEKYVFHFDGENKINFVQTTILDAWWSNKRGDIQ
ncbi:MAG: hypothetical protein II611_11660, partial [Treponema sp.]|nr:hypothetical protein [Treponema sp.]